MLGDKLETVIAACEFIRNQFAETQPPGACLNHALALRWALNQKGTYSRVITGEAFWQVGSSPHDTIVFCRSEQGAGGFHAWVEVDTPNGSVNIDPTCYTLAKYATQEGIAMTWRAPMALIWAAGSILTPVERVEPGAWSYMTS